ncbi:conserved Plasmodium protein, unknown function [Plasmodium knowlesi strain H]|uniref:Uncharacterized protein n=3 Tax=Plasmodium knowlesi TaxID=5850 RepID=A0A5K1UAZ6_PLAKH|nr:uncharacterized protein PKNH_1471100 [Plasmodium knowlesi strain H]OTN64009.1 Uncharacterized protein PKNOH_S140289800 [Plasmodium knowlesi]CAA9991308.1 conserved Plasmodium protein, unknown function [Plasmodium knowlesi strain H]SBO26416.1 conserved Plasmodium protein, unknown function [Plasmodium knowlesi strain H]SBO28985.1 conserved Plasmodium protein, unknown function [Plasmodium knowlesi strain H]VVS80782.1 conserved Plasmodium protein, unknown function [Plasmodium knowlesi strain H]|eukprot:XP_002262587.1 [Plasmodium knowlesi strain H]
MGKQSESKPFKKNFNSSNKRNGMNSGSPTSSDQENSEIDFQNRRRDLLKETGSRRKSNDTLYSYSRMFVTVLNYIFCILGIICAWGAIDSLVQVISGRQVYLSLTCYSIILLFSLVFLMLYIYFLDRDYRPCDFF